MPTPRNISQIKLALLQPATTSHFEVRVPNILPVSYLRDNQVVLDQNQLNLLCSEATLPGSNLATLDLTNDHTGVTEKHAYRRVYDDRIDLTFYVDAKNYLPIRFFETWIKWVANESRATDQNIGASIKSDNYFYRFKYRDSYVAKQGLEVTKFEKSSNGYGSSGEYDFKTRADNMTYQFVNSFPISLTSMPVSYDSSSLLKCTVSMSYIRYYIDKTVNEGTSSTNETLLSSNFNATPQQLASINSQSFNSNINLSSILGNTTTTGGVNFNSAASSGNSIGVQDSYSRKFNLNV
jgi:hypothetical protein